MAGGSGSRLWPLSRQLNPKQFLKLTDKKLSMLQATVARLEGISAAAPLVICNEEHRFLVAEQLRQQNKEENCIIPNRGHPHFRVNPNNPKEYSHAIRLRALKRRYEELRNYARRYA